MSTPTLLKRLDQARVSSKRSRLLKHIQATAGGSRPALKVDLADKDVDLARLIEVATSQDGDERRDRVVAALRRSGAFDTIIDQLAAADTARRARSARLAGALRVEPAVSWLASLLSSEEATVRSAAAGALGKIRGYHSAEALSRAIRHRGARPKLVIELTRSAPDLYLETLLCGPAIANVREAAATAAGLRRRRTAVRPLIGLLTSGSRSERVASYRALGWIGAPGSAAVVASGLDDQDWRIRLSAAKALGNLDARAHRRQLEAALADADRRVRRAAYSALRRQVAS